MNSESVMQSFWTALRLLTRIPTPNVTSNRNQEVLACFPIVGLLVGMLVALAGTLIIRGIFMPAAIFVCALLLPMLGWWLTHARGLKSLIWLASRWNEAEEDEEDQYGGVPCRPYWVLISMQGVLITRAALTGLLCALGYVSIWWLVVPFILGMATHAELFSQTALDEEAEREEFSFHWIIAAVLVIAISLLLRSFLPGLLALVLAWVLTGMGGRLMTRHFGEAGSYGYAAVREAVELAALLAGVLSFSGLAYKIS